MDKRKGAKQFAPFLRFLKFNPSQTMIKRHGVTCRSNGATSNTIGLVYQGFLPTDCH